MSGVAVAKVFCHKICSLLLCVISVPRRILSLVLPRKLMNSSQPLLPTTVSTKSTLTQPGYQHEQQDENSYHQQKRPTLEPVEWDASWENAPSQVEGQENLVNGQTEQDFFQDMVPQFKRAPKVKVKLSNSGSVQTRNGSDNFTSKFGVQNVPLYEDMSELGEIDEFGANTWEEETNLELGAGDMDAVLRESRQIERERRHQEQQRRREKMAEKKQMTRVLK